jgi:hypothetical protein
MSGVYAVPTVPVDVPAAECFQHVAPRSLGVLTYPVDELTRYDILCPIVAFHSAIEDDLAMYGRRLDSISAWFPCQVKAISRYIDRTYTDVGERGKLYSALRAFCQMAIRDCCEKTERQTLVDDLTWAETEYEKKT